MQIPKIRAPLRLIADVATRSLPRPIIGIRVFRPHPEPFPQKRAAAALVGFCGCKVFECAAGPVQKATTGFWKTRQVFRPGVAQGFFRPNFPPLGMPPLLDRIPGSLVPAIEQTRP